MILNSLQRLSLEDRQYSHLPQFIPGAMRTCWPIFKSLTVLPIPAIFPVISQPGICGSGIVMPGIPSLTHISRWFIPHAFTLTRTSEEEISGFAKSVYSNLSTLPCSLITTAFIILLSQTHLFRRRMQGKPNHPAELQKEYQAEFR